MRVERIESRALEIPLKRAYAIATGAADAAQLVAVRLTAGRHVGLGAASPAPSVTGETFAACRDALDPARLDWLIGGDVLALPALCRELRVRLPQTPAARAAVDIALHDLWAKQLGRPLVELLGRAHARLPTSITIGIKDAAATLAEAEEYVARGFRILKVKIGLSLDADLERLRALRARFGAAVSLRADANSGYGPAEIVPLLRAASELGLELVEQPLPRGAEDALRALPPAARRALVADESMRGLDDALALASEPRPFGGFNIKLMKCGGVHEALRIASVATEAGLDLMWGCMDESASGIAAALHVALASPATRYLDLDGSFDLTNDPAVGGFALGDGMLSTLDRPGLGVDDAG